MIVKETMLQGAYEIENKLIHDARGSFVKTIHADVFKSYGLDFDFKESFYSVSRKGVVRGMHFQLPPHDHSKLVYVTSGEILDVVVDIRKGSPTYGKYHSTVLSSDTAKSIYVGKGFAHGFLSCSESATVVYSTTSVYSPECDAGIRWNSFGFDWGIENPILSDRDQGFVGLYDE